VGTAYHARHLRNGNLVALKLMHDRLASDIEVQKRFVREVSVLQKLDHPNIVRHLDCGLDDGRIYFAMEWVEFGTLEQVLKRRNRLPWREVVECGIQACLGLQHAHEKQIIHRDLKPANMFLSSDGRLKIGDFGLARDMNLHRLTDEGNTVGTCRFMAPEQVRGAHQLTGAVDLYALGCVMFRMIGGQVPFDGSTVVEVFEKHLYSDVPSLRTLAPDCPPEVDQLIRKLLTKEPSERPANAAEVAQALKDILDGRPIAESFTTAPTEEESVESEPVEPVPPPNLTERLLADPPATPGNKVANWMFVAGLVAMLALIALLSMFRRL
jgi:eukaryotic-like serine/threonine-protein kinase